MAENAPKLQFGFAPFCHCGTACSGVVGTFLPAAVGECCLAMSAPTLLVECGYERKCPSPIGIPSTFSVRKVSFFNSELKVIKRSTKNN